MEVFIQVDIKEEMAEEKKGEQQMKIINMEEEEHNQQVELKDILIHMKEEMEKNQKEDQDILTNNILKENFIQDQMIFHLHLDQMKMVILEMDMLKYLILIILDHVYLM